MMNPHDAVQLKTLTIGSRRFRYILVKKKRAFSKERYRNNADDELVLFFGGDVLQNTSVSSKNKSREHFNLSKSSHSCKVSFPLRVLGLKANEAWFYDVKGLFHVAFHFYNFEEQRSILTTLFTLWSKCDENEVLPSTIAITSEDLIRENDFRPSVLVFSKNTNTSKECSVCLPEQRRQSFEKQCGRVDRSFQTNTCISQSASVQTMPMQMSENVATPMPQDSAIQSYKSKIQEASVQTYSERNHVKEKLEVVQTNHEIIIGKEVCCQTENNESPDNSTNQTPQKRKLAEHTETQQTLKKQLVERKSTDDTLLGVQFIDRLSDVLKEFYSASTHNIIFYKVYVLVEAFLFLLQNELQVIERTRTGIFPFHLIQEYASFRKVPPMNLEVPIEVYYEDVALKLHGRWLGAQFYKFQGVIACHIEEYKRNLINHNKCLPSAVKLITESGLYPNAMIEFLNLWMHGGNVERDDQQFLCAKILLILELMNDNLITGVGHVVYAKLKSLDTM